MNLYIGIDNGISGSISILYVQDQELVDLCYLPIPKKTYIKFTKNKIASENRIDHIVLKKILEEKILNRNTKGDTKIALELPYINLKTINSTFCAIKAFEAVRIILEQLNLDYIIISSHEWKAFFEVNKYDIQKHSSQFSSIASKKAIYQTIRFYIPQLDSQIKDVDSILIALYLYYKDNLTI